MPEEVDESVVRADRWSKVIAVFWAGGTFLVTVVLTGDQLFSMIVAAVAGIGVRIYVPYHASITAPDADQEPIQHYEGTGNYHQGAVGAGAVIAATVTVPVAAVGLGSNVAMAVGGGVGVVAFLILRAALPS